MSYSPTPADILQRLERLERQNRRLRLWGVIAFAALLFGFTPLSVPRAVLPLIVQGPILGILTPSAIEAQRFVLRDSQGQLRGGMQAVGEWSAKELVDDERRPRLMLQLTEGRLTISLQSEDGTIFRLQETFDGSTTMVMSATGGPGDGNAISMSAGPKDIEPFIHIFGKEGGDRGLHLSATDQENEPRLWIRDGRGNSVSFDLPVCEMASTAPSCD